MELWSYFFECKEETRTIFRIWVYVKKCCGILTTRSLITHSQFGFFLLFKQKMIFCPKIGFYKNIFGCDIVISWFGRENQKVPSMPKRK